MRSDVVHSESTLGRAYRVIYQFLCGRHPNPYPWHFQWASTFYLNRSLRKLLPGMGGRIIDVGCGAGPYRSWFGLTESYLGLDVAPGPAVDMLITPEEPWPLADSSFDVLISSQVIEHAKHPELTLREIERVLKRGGVAVLSFPFLYNEHAAPDDYRRFTISGAQQLLPAFQILLLERQGGIGSTVVIMFLNWIELSLNRSMPARLLKALILPIWAPICFLANMLGIALDMLDKTDAFYNNVLLVVRRP